MFPNHYLAGGLMGGTPEVTIIDSYAYLCIIVICPFAKGEAKRAVVSILDML